MKRPIGTQNLTLKPLTITKFTLKKPNGNTPKTTLDNKTYHQVGSKATTNILLDSTDDDDEDEEEIVIDKIQLINSK